MANVFAFCGDLRVSNTNASQDERVIKEKRAMALKGRCKQQKSALDAAKLDIQRLKRTIKTLEVSYPSGTPVQCIQINDRVNVNFMKDLISNLEDGEYTLLP